MFGRRCAEPRALALLFALVGCSQFEAPLVEHDAGLPPVEPDDSGVDAAVDSSVDEPDTGTDAEATVHDASTPESTPDAEVDAGRSSEDASSPDAAVVIPRRPALSKCGFTAPVTTGTLSYAGLNEVSGMAVSRKNARVLWLIEDSGNGSQVHAMNDQGTLIATYAVGGTAVDYEDIAVGPGPLAGESYIYIADIGDNSGSRQSVAVYRAPEPSVAWDQALVTGALSAVEPFPFKYPDGPHNAEALMVDPLTQDIYVISKDGFTYPNTLYRLGAPQQVATVRTLEAAGALFGGVGNDLAVTGADMSADGKRIMIRTLHSATHWLRPTSVSVADAMLLGTACDAELASENKGESISFSSAGYYSISEGASEPLHFVSYTSP